MTAPLSMDLRQRILDAHLEEGLGVRRLAKRFRVHINTVRRLLRRHRETGSLEPTPYGGGVPKAITDDQLPAIRKLVADAPDATLPELAELYAERTGICVSRQTMGRAVRRANCTRKKSASKPSNATRPG